MKEILKRLPLVKSWARKLNNLNERTEWVTRQLQNLPRGSLLLDAGCGSQQFRVFCDHLNYKGQDFGQYVVDEKKMIGAEERDLGSGFEYQYGELDYVGDIWDINETDASFDAILCTEVFEHIPHPIETVKEFSRLIKPGGTLILTAPNACLRHLDPYYYYSGFSDRWYENFLTENGFEIEEIVPVGDYYSWLAVEMARTGMANSLISKAILFPAFIYFFSKKKTETSMNTLCMGYHVLAKKI
jgi:SAM-dependent methyltransferase